MTMFHAFSFRIYDPATLIKMSQNTDQKSSSTTARQKVILEAELNRLALMRYRRRNFFLGLGLLTGVLSIYGYSMYAVRQESLDLDDLDLDKPIGQGSSTLK